MTIKMEERVTRLEEELVFQERHIEGLNEALAGQQKQMDRLEALIKRQERKIQELEEALEGTSGGAPVNQPPPHYL